ncbi:MAG: thermonuclease family protein [Alphaproteobacteria bacterium]|nr:thermonuclease family protein [Alphaproteobacteria bacterium]
MNEGLAIPGIAMFEVCWTRRLVLREYARCGCSICGDGEDMFGWRRKRDGFEWRGYVRTTILLKRKKRREKLGDAKQAAIDGIAEAGRAGKAAGHAGVEAAKQGLGLAGREAKVAGAHLGERLAKGAKRSGVKARWAAKLAGAAARKGALKAGSEVWSFSKSAAGRIGGASSQGLGGLRAGVTDGVSKAGGSISPRVGLPLVVAGLAAAIGAASRIYQLGADPIGLAAGALALILLAVAVLPVAAGRSSIGAPFSTRRHDPDAVPAEAEAPGSPNLFAAFTSIAAVVIAVSLIGSLVWYGGASVGELAKTAPATFSAPEKISGKAVSLTGDSMRIGDAIVLLKGIEAPEVRQRCKTERGRSWRCGRSALNALRRITGYETIACTVSSTTDAGSKVASCKVGEKDIAAELVQAGHVFANGGMLATYASQEGAAREAKRGIWQGEAQRPADYRTKLWESAKAKAPNGCPIKGRALSKGKVYLLPWSPDYARYRVSQRRGDKWFCSESEAISEGWKLHDS